MTQTARARDEGRGNKGNKGIKESRTRNPHDPRNLLLAELVSTVVRTVGSGRYWWYWVALLLAVVDLPLPSPHNRLPTRPSPGRSPSLSLSSFLSNCPSLSSLPLPSPPRRPAPCGTTLQFGDSVLDMGWPDHHSPPLSVTWRACNMMSAWLLSSPDNVVVVHCNAGKGRTG